jgi:hypothetical protein
MTTTVTMLQTRLGESGSLWTVGNSYAASDAFAAVLISSNLATGTLPKSRSLVPLWGQTDTTGAVTSVVDTAGNTYAIAEERVDVVNRRAVFDGGVIPDNRKRAIVKTKTVTNSDNSDYIEPTRDRRIVMSLDSNTATSTITATGGQVIALFAAAAAAGFRWDEPNRPFRYISAGAQASGAVVTVKEVA